MDKTLSFLYSTSRCHQCGTEERSILCLACQEVFTKQRCFRYRGSIPGINFCLSPYCYSGPTGQLIQEAKKERSRKIAEGVQLVAKRFAQEFLPSQSWDRIIPLPTRWSSISQRGYHLPLMIAEAISLECRSRPVTLSEKRCLQFKWWQRGLQQKFLSQAERKNNVENCFRVRTGSLEGLSLLLVDDVVGTGATLMSAATALGKYNPARIEAFCLAHSHRSGNCKGHGTSSL